MDTREEILEKLAKITVGNSYWMDRAKFRIENHEWLTISAKIALKILGYLRENKMTKLDLANKLNVPEEVVNAMVKGGYDFKLSEISRIEKEINIK